MYRTWSVLLVLLSFVALSAAQTADELVAKNLAAKGGVEKIKAINTLRTTGRMLMGGMVAEVGRDQKRPDMIRNSFTLQSMTATQAYDGNTAWQISPFQGRRDPEGLGEDDARDLIENADIGGPLVDYKAKGNTIEYLGHDTVDGDDVFLLKVTLKNGDIYYYYLDPDTYLEIRTERQQFIRGSVREEVTDLGSYKQVAGVYFPFSIEIGQKGSQDKEKVTVEKMEANVPMNDTEFKMPSAPAPKPAAPPAKKD